MISKGYKLRLKNAFVKQKLSGEITPVTIQDAEASIRKLIEYVRDAAALQLTYPQAWHNKTLLNAQEEIRKREVDEYNATLPAGAKRKSYPRLKPHEEARQAGINHKTHPKNLMVKSRVEFLIRDQIVSKLKKWDGSITTKPNAGLSINLGAASVAMASVVKRKDEAWLYFKAWDREFLLQFNVPKHLNKASKISLPNISINKESGKIVYSFAFEFEQQSPRISSEYVLGVDRGIKNLAAWSVTSISSNEPVLEGFLSENCSHLQGKIARIEEEKSNLYKKLCKPHVISDLERYTRLITEYKRKRAKAKRLKVDLCKQAAQELVAISALFDNCIISLEQLNWAGNWKSKVPFGLLKHWVEHYAEQSGSHVQLVNAKNTSRECSHCGAIKENLSLNNRVYKCDECLLVIDRDINAARNIANRAAATALKTSKTRDKTSKTRKRSRLLKRKRLRITGIAVTPSWGSVVTGLVGNEPPPYSGLTTPTRVNHYYRL